MFRLLCGAAALAERATPSSRQDVRLSSAERDQPWPAALGLGHPPPFSPPLPHPRPASLAQPPLPADCSRCRGEHAFAAGNCGAKPTGTGQPGSSGRNPPTPSGAVAAAGAGGRPRSCKQWRGRMGGRAARRGPPSGRFRRSECAGPPGRPGGPILLPRASTRALPGTQVATPVAFPASQGLGSPSWCQGLPDCPKRTARGGCDLRRVGVAAGGRATAVTWATSLQEGRPVQKGSVPSSRVVGTVACGCPLGKVHNCWPQPRSEELIMTPKEKKPFPSQKVGIFERKLLNMNPETCLLPRLPGRGGERGQAVKKGWRQPCWPPRSFPPRWGTWFLSVGGQGRWGRAVPRDCSTDSKQDLPIFSLQATCPSLGCA